MARRNLDQCHHDLTHPIHTGTDRLRGCWWAGAGVGGRGVSGAVRGNLAVGSSSVTLDGCDPGISQRNHRLMLAHGPVAFPSGLKAQRRGPSSQATRDGIPHTGLWPPGPLNLGTRTAADPEGQAVERPGVGTPGFVYGGGRRMKPGVPMGRARMNQPEAFLEFETKSFLNGTAHF